MVLVLPNVWNLYIKVVEYIKEEEDSKADNNE